MTEGRRKLTGNDLSCPFQTAGSRGCSTFPGRPGFNTALTSGPGPASRITPMPDGPLKVEVMPGSREGHAVMRLDGPLTLANLFGFQGSIRSEESSNLIIDLSAVPYIDSAGIGSLVGAQVSRQQKGRALTLAGVNERVLNSLKITNVVQFFAIFSTLAEAEESLIRLA